jgi:hypothetical protein
MSFIQNRSTLLETCTIGQPVPAAPTNHYPSADGIDTQRKPVRQETRRRKALDMPAFGGGMAAAGGRAAILNDW